MMKFLIVIVLLVVAAAGLWWSGVLKDYLPASFSAFTSKAPAQEPAPAPAQQQPVSDLPTDQGDSSDAAIVQDSAAVDAQLKGLDSDEAGADQGLNDKPTAQEF